MLSVFGIVQRITHTLLFMCQGLCQRVVNSIVVYPRITTKNNFYVDCADHYVTVSDDIIVLPRCMLRE
jgi:hypothetical protein